MNSETEKVRRGNWSSTILRSLAREISLQLLQKLYVYVCCKRCVGEVLVLGKWSVLSPLDGKIPEWMFSQELVVADYDACQLVFQSLAGCIRYAFGHTLGQS